MQSHQVVSRDEWLTARKAFLAKEKAFNRDYGVSFTSAEREQGEIQYNYATRKFFSSEAPGISVFNRDGNGNIFHTYFCYARGLDMLNGAYHYLDLVLNGRDEAALSYPMAWVRLHDQY